MDLVEPHQNRNQIQEKNFPFIIELTVPLPQCSGGESFQMFHLSYIIQTR